MALLFPPTLRVVRCEGAPQGADAEGQPEVWHEVSANGRCYKVPSADIPCVTFDPHLGQGTLRINGVAAAQYESYMHMAWPPGAAAGTAGAAGAAPVPVPPHVPGLVGSGMRGALVSVAVAGASVALAAAEWVWR